MKAIIPLARLKKYSSAFNPLLKIGEKTFLERLVDNVMHLSPKEIIFIVGDNYREIIHFLNSKYKNNNFRFIRQKKKKGIAHAIYGAKKAVKEGEELFIVLGDTFLSNEVIEVVKKKPKRNVIFTYDKEDNFSKYGVVFVQEGKITKLIEKPTMPLSTLIIIGAYYIKNAKKLFDAIKKVIDSGVMHNNEYHLTDALQYMINEGEIFENKVIKTWFDLEEEQDLLEAQEYILTTEYSKKSIRRDYNKNVVIIPPVYISKSASVYNAIIGPNVSIGDHAVVENCIIMDSLIGERANVENVKLSNSIIGEGSYVKAGFMHLNLPPNTIFKIETKDKIE